MVNPVQMAFDTKGRLWVAVWPTYPHWKPTEPMNDKLLILEDTNGDGKADVCKAFAADLHNPTGFEFWNNGVLVAQGPDLLFLKDTDGDDKYDVKERVVHGLDTADTHHTANSFVLDPGGALYFQEGTFHHSQVETVWGPPRRVANGAVFRYEPRAQKFDVYVSYGFANPHGHVFDRWGQDIVWDGTGAVPYHAVLFSGDVDFPHKHGGTPQLYQQRTRPCSGTEILYSSHFPDEYQGNLLVLNVIGFQGILRYKVEDKGSSFTAVEQEPMLSSTDPNFRPTDIETAPDGSVYFVDWQNPIIGHMQHNLRDPSRDRTHGRVYRVTHKERPLVRAAKVAGEPIERLLNLLKSPEGRERYRARIELSGRKTDDVIPALTKWIGRLDASDPEYEHQRLEGLWLFQNHNVVNGDLLRQVLRSPDFRARAAATRVLVAWRDRVPDVLDLLQTQVNDEHPRVRLMAIWGLSYFHGQDAARAAEIVVEALIHPDDPFIQHALSETNKTLDRRIQALGK
jgi:glucose/arabinose dehydrogenase